MTSQPFPSIPPDQFEKLADMLEVEHARLDRPACVMGFDGFIDEVMRIVEERRGPGDFDAVPDIPAFAAWAASCGGRSGLREAVLDEVAPGGCTMNMGDGLATLGVAVDCFAMLGEPPADAFVPWLKKFRTFHPLPMEPGSTRIFEFLDGKLMFARMSHFEEFTPEFLEAHFPLDAYLAACKAAPAIVLTSWSVYPYMTECWQWLNDRAFSKLDERPVIYVDVADPASRSAADRMRMLETLGALQRHGRVSLNLNLNEANHFARSAGLREADDAASDTERLAQELRARAGIAELGIHLVRGATVAVQDGMAVSVAGPYCARPRKSTGAGDRFNSGYCTGLLMNLEAPLRLLLGCAVSGFYVRNARSGTLPDVSAFLRRWAAHGL